MSKINKIKVENTTYDVQDNTSGYVTKEVNNLTNYELKVSTANNILMTLDNTTYVLTLSLRNSANEVLNTQSVDLPLESVVVDGEYDSTNKKIILELQNGNTIDVPVGDLINGLQSEITSSNKLDASLVDDSLSTNKFTNASEKATWNGKADISDIPTAVSELTNDSGYQTLSEVEALISGLGSTKVDVFENVYSTSPFIFDTKDVGIYVNKNVGAGETLFYYKKSESDSSATQISGYVIQNIIIYKNVNDIGVPEQQTYFALANAFKISELALYKILLFVKTNGTIGFSANELYNKPQYLLNDRNITQIIDGLKQFSTIPQQSNTTAPTLDVQFTNKKYVDDLVGSISGGSDITIITNNSNGNEFVFEGKEKGVYLFQQIVNPDNKFWFKANESSSAVNQDINPIMIVLNQKVENISSNTVIGNILCIASYSGQYGKLMMATISYDGSNITISNYKNYGNSMFVDSNAQTYAGEKTFSSIPKVSSYTAPTQNTQLAAKKYVDDKPTTYTGYDATKTQVLKNINGTLTWVDET